MSVLAVKVVKTVEELAALPAGTILADNGGWPFWHDRLRGWCAANGSHDVDPATAIRDGAPFTVLYRPEREVLIKPSYESVREAIFQSTYPGLRWVDLTEEEAADFTKATDAIVALLPGRTEQEVAAEVLEMTARALQMNTWVDLIKGGPFEQRVGNAQRVVDWLRARSRSLSGSES